MTVIDRFASFFVDEGKTDLVKNYGEAKEFVEWAHRPPGLRLIAWLEAEASRPFKIGEQSAMIESAVRANTFREIVNRIRRDAKVAEADMRQYEMELRDARD